MGNPNKNSNSEHASETLKKYYSDNKIKKKHSEIHKNLFNDIDEDNLESIEIKPINEKGIPKLVYLYFRYNDGKSFRRRYGGIHISFEDNISRCLADIKEKFDGISVINYVENKYPTEDVKLDGNITITDFKYEGKCTIAMYYKKDNKRTRKVFGGKTSTYAQAFEKCVQFIKDHWKHPTVNLSDSLKATLPNCGKLLKNINTTQ